MDILGTHQCIVIKFSGGRSGRRELIMASKVCQCQLRSQFSLTRRPKRSRAGKSQQGRRDSKRVQPTGIRAGEQDKLPYLPEQTCAVLLNIGRGTFASKAHAVIGDISFACYLGFCVGTYTYHSAGSQSKYYTGFVHLETTYHIVG
jgi:hypothetical protein